MRYTKDDSRAYAQQRANDTGSPYMVVSVVGIDDLWYSMLDCPHNRRVIKECNALHGVTFELFRPTKGR